MKEKNKPNSKGAVSPSPKKRGRPKKIRRGRPPKAKEPKKRGRKPKKERKSITTYTLFQRLFSKYCKENNINYGKDFNKIVSQVWRKLDDSQKNIKFIENNYFVIFKKHFSKPHKQFEDVPFFAFIELIKDQVFDDVNIIVSFKHPYTFEEINLEGDREEIISEWRNSGLYRILRKDFNGSDDLAFLHVFSTDNETYVDYQVITGKNVEELMNRNILVRQEAKIRVAEEFEREKEKEKEKEKGPIQEPKIQPKIEPTEKEKPDKIGDLAREEFEKLTSQDLKEIIKAREERQEREKIREFKVSELKKAVEDGIITKKEYLEFIMKL